MKGGGAGRSVSADTLNPSGDRKMPRTTKRAAASKSQPRAKRTRKTKSVTFIEKPTCATCRKARRFLQKRGVPLDYRDLTKDKLSSSEIEKLIGRHDHEDFLRPRSSLFQKLKMKNKPPSRREAIALMAKNPDLIRRPVIVAGGRVVIGYDENGMIRF